MTSYQNELQILIAELQTAVVRCETSQRFRLKPDFQRDFDEFEKLFNFASEVFDQREDLSQQFSFMKKQMFASLEIARFIFARLDITNRSMASILSWIHADLVDCNLRSLILFVELQISACGEALPIGWDSICF